MKKVFSNQEILILSDKEFTRNDGGILIFADGSYVDIYSRKIVNKGSGKIIIKDLPLWPSMADIIRNQQTYKEIRHLIVHGGMNNIVIVPNDSDDCIVSLGGSEDFVNNSFIEQHEDHLYIETPRSNSNVHINVSSIWVNGRRVPPKLDDDFGYIEIKAQNLQSLFVTGNGTGEIYSELPLQTLRTEIKGSSSLDLIQVSQADIKITGSGSVSIENLCGNLSGTISGSGNITILDGNAEEVDVSVSGSGDLVAGITAKIARLSLSGSGTIIVAHVLDESIEQKTGSGILKIIKKGCI